jgi:hypothetical protein
LVCATVIAIGAALPPELFPTIVLLASVASPDSGMVGRSPATRAQSETEVAVPQVPTTSCEVWPVAADIAKVPLFTIGEPDTVSQDGTVCATLVTVPALPPPTVTHE